MTMADAKFEDGGEQALSLKAETAEDLAVISALVQDAVLPATEMRWDRKGRTLALLLNKFRWEDRASAEKTARPYERVRSLLVISDVTHVWSWGSTGPTRTSFCPSCHWHGSQRQMAQAA